VLTLYHIFSTFLALIVVPVFSIYAIFTVNKRKGLSQHFGEIPSPPKTKDAPKRKTLWLYALSLGEVISAEPMLKIIHNERPDIRLVVTVTTDSGYDGARAHLAFVDQITFHPIDCLPFNLSALDAIQPDVYVITDTGIWPGLLDLMERRKIPVLLFNGRISERSAKRYLRFDGIAKSLFNKFTLLCMQNQRGWDIINAIGLDREKVRTIGDPKYDAVQTVSKREQRELRDSLALDNDTPVWVAGSTHEGEEEIILDAFRIAQKSFPNLMLILAPRRMERIDSVSEILDRKEISYADRSEFLNGIAEVILLDTMGELAIMYSIADIAFVGNSLIKPGGGHSLIEPLAQGIMTLHGPHIQHMRHVAKVLHPHGLAIEVSTAEEIAKEIESLLADETRKEIISQTGPKVLKQFQGASRIMAEIVLDLMR
jgi:3-deoxy-D-manno-octulosonic-acid transferase